MPTEDTGPPTSTEISIGSDPEFVCLDQGGELINVAGLVPRTGTFGADGHGYIGEIRPKPAVFPRDLVENIRLALLEGFNYFPNADWKVAPFLNEKPLGGHIHLGIPLNDRFAEALDRQLGIILALIEPSALAKQRRNTVFVGSGGHINNNGAPYGALGDVRPKPYGFEWRTPSSFIVSPGITLSLISLTKAIIWEEQIKGKNAWSRLSKIKRKELHFNSKDFYDAKRSKFLPLLPKLWPLIKSMDYFKPHMEGKSLWTNVSYLRKCIEKSGFRVFNDIKPKWKINQHNHDLNKTHTLTPKGGRTRRIDRRTQRIEELRNNAVEQIHGEWVMENGIIVPINDQGNIFRKYLPDEILMW